MAEGHGGGKWLPAWPGNREETEKDPAEGISS
jgi:hypothetical protein